ncbi:MAG: putative biopolymer transporter protein [Candidatus Brocadia fulgida]|uniref:Biopolymer transporter protein n=1 Tax=Candidatus Brocadia fulgida TaxID=380242 RepID=A0A0M2US86_9BACT|nr:MAG: putative biopolymer transporter protein [Candidatus Brocadia fulgida]
MEWLIGGGPIMIPLLICSILALAVIIERAINLRRNHILKPEIIRTIETIRSQQDIPLALSKCEVIPGPFSNLLRRILTNNHLTREEKFIDIQAAGRQETKSLERRLLVLEVITAVAPLLGLLGTVLGLEDIFGIISELGLGQAKRFPRGLQKRSEQPYSDFLSQSRPWLLIVISIKKWIPLSWRWKNTPCTFSINFILLRTAGKTEFSFSGCPRDKQWFMYGLIIIFFAL